MPRNHWWDTLRARNAALRSGLQSKARLSKAGRRLINRRASFEKLEERLALTVALRPGPLGDVVIVSPTANSGEYDALLGPAIVSDGTAVDSGPVIIDLSAASNVDRRYSVPGSHDGPLFRIDTGQRYTLSAAGHPRVGELQQGIFGYQSFDVDQLLIETIHVAKYGLAADTTLTAALNPSDTSFLIADASGWSNSLGESAATRSLAWYGYTDSTGFTYADFSYTRNVASDSDDGLWAPGAIWFDTSAGAYRVTLNSPWAGPAIAAGMAVRNAESGPQLSEPFPESLINSPARWQQHAVTIGGEWQNGQRDELAFRPGTAFVRPIAISPSVWNHLAFGPEADFPGETSTILVPASVSQIVLDLDVLAKEVTSFTGDFNQDGTVSAADYAVWRNSMGQTQLVPFSGADANGDGKVDALDLKKWKTNFGATLSLTIDSATATHGTATIVHGPGSDYIHYISDHWFVGSDIVEYTIRDAGTGATYSAQLVVEAIGSNFEQDAAIVATLEAQAQVVAGNQAPRILVDPVFNVMAGQTTSTGSLLSPFTDPVDAMVVRLLSGPEHGALRLNYDGTFEYTPADGFVGYDTFRYEAFDGLNATAALATIKVMPADELLESRLDDIGLGMLNHESSKKAFPVTNNSAYFDENGQPYLSWRVHLLPYLGFQSLFNEFHLDEPWDSPHNLPLLAEIPDVFRTPGDAPSSTTTRMQTFTGPDAPFGNRGAGVDQIGPRINDFKDNYSHTILVAHSGADAAVPWTKPQDMAFDVNNPLAALGTIGSEDIYAVMADGTTIKLLSSIDPATFKALVTIDGNEIVDAETLRREYLEAKGLADQPGGVREDNYLRQLALAAQTYADSKKTVPIAPGSANFDASGNPFVSWRVHILPYLGYVNLYERFRLNEPWDSPNNLPLLAEMPDVFRSAGDASDSTTTRLQYFTGPDAPFGTYPPGIPQVGPSYAQVSDGTSNTILYIEAAADQAVPWTKPDDLEFDKNHPFVGVDTTQNIRTVLFDGHLAILRPDISAADFAALVSRKGREPIDPKDFEINSSAPFKSGDQRKWELRQLLDAMYDHHNTTKRFPGNRVDAAGTPLLSWRVMILPYIEQRYLFDQFHLNEPWDSPHNLSLLKFMPDVFRSSGDPLDSTSTSVMNFTGPGAPYPSQPTASQLGPRTQDIQDGTSRTIALIEASADNAAPWTKPVDLPYHANNPFSALGELGEEFLAAFFDGHIETLSTLLSPGDLKARITHQSGEDITVPNPIVTAPGVFLIQTGGDTRANEFGVDSFYAVLDRAPVSEVVIDFSTSDGAIAGVDKPRLTFTAANWNVPQQVALRGVDNHVVNPDRTVEVTLSIVDALSDAAYHAVPNQTFSATIVDDDPQVPALPGDYNLDGNVNTADYAVWRNNEGKTNQFPYRGADGNGDGRIDALDYQVWRQNYGSTGSAAATLAAAPATASSGAAALAHEPVAATALIEFGPSTSRATTPLKETRTTAAISAVAEVGNDLLLLAVDAVAKQQALPTTPYEASDAAFSEVVGESSWNESLAAAFDRLA